jgi:hypothetical protein
VWQARDIVDLCMNEFEMLRCKVKRLPLMALSVMALTWNRLSDDGGGGGDDDDGDGDDDDDDDDDHDHDDDNDNKNQPTCSPTPDMSACSERL